MSKADITVQGTPNPNAAKFVVSGVSLGTNSRSYFGSHEVGDDELAARLFSVQGVRALLIVDNFITVTKADEVTWDDIVEDITWIIGEALG
ncbi:MAG: NifU N-terminal domain-containing protein [Candidatus Palauibacterales bacterium]|jgi:Scaffold protein Nfu/NifU N terminal|nr:NifU N-terminal domain-containing protein [Candidatus Palauibacterales bacterium]